MGALFRVLTPFLRYVGTGLKWIGGGYLFTSFFGDDDDSTPFWVWTLVGAVAMVVLFFVFFGDRGRKILMRRR